MTRPENQHQEAFSWSFPLEAVSADATLEIAKPTKAYLITSVRYVNPTGLAADAANYYEMWLRINANTAAAWSTKTGEEGALVAATWVDFVLSASSARNGDAGDEISILLDETGTQTLPAGTLYIEGIFL